MTLPEIVGAYHSRHVNDETYCWKDGMADWLPIREIHEIMAAISQGPQPTMNPDVGGYEQQQQQQPPADDQPTQAGFSSLFGMGGQRQQQQPQNGGAALFGGGTAAPAAAATPAARRAGGRGGGGADLFGSAAQAGGEQDVMTSASASPQPVEDSKMTGQRNENSVLFSLAALTSSTHPKRKTTRPMAQGEGSGLIDIRALSASMETKKDGKRRSTTS